MKQETPLEDHNSQVAKCGLIKEMKIETGTRDYWQKLHFPLPRTRSFCSQKNLPTIKRERAMRRYSPFVEKAGMKKVAEQQSAENFSKVSKMLLEFGFDLQLLGNERYIREKFETLSADQICKLIEVFVKNNRPRFKREFTGSRHQPFGKTSDYLVSLKELTYPRWQNWLSLLECSAKLRFIYFGEAR